MGNKVDQLEKRVSELEESMVSVAKWIKGVTDSNTTKKEAKNETKTQTSRGKRKEV